MSRIQRRINPSTSWDWSVCVVLAAIDDYHWIPMIPAQVDSATGALELYLTLSGGYIRRTVHPTH